MPADRFADAIVVYANNAQFSPGQRRLFSRVESRMLLWCKAGKGTVTANKLTCDFEPGRYLFLPWGHSIAYEASTHDPFFLAGIHIIPRHARERTVTYDVAHHPDHPVAGATFRRDLKIPAMAGVKQGTLDPNEPLTQLAEYIVGVFIRGNPPEWQARQLAQQLLHELVLAERKREVYDHGVPPALERMKQYILFNIQRPLSLSHLVGFAKLSPSTIGRMFRDHLHTTPVTWILRVKMRRARTLLRTRRLSVAEVGEQVGISDSYYFSKCFKKETGYSPLEYRRQRHWI